MEETNYEINVGEAHIGSSFAQSNEISSLPQILDYYDFYNDSMLKVLLERELKRAFESDVIRFKAESILIAKLSDDIKDFKDAYEMYIHHQKCLNEIYNNEKILRSSLNEQQEQKLSNIDQLKLSVILDITNP